MMVRSMRAANYASVFIDDHHHDVHEELLLGGPGQESGGSPLIDLTNSNDWPQEVEVPDSIDRGQNDTLATAAANMISVLSTTMKHIQALVQKRHAERAANANLDNSVSTACECSICREILYASTSCSTLCGHVFHAACIYQLSEYQRKKTVPCPVCRTPVHPGELVVLRNGLPEPPAGEQPDSNDVSVQNFEEDRSQLDHMLTRTLRTFEKISAEEKVFQHCAKELRRNVREEVHEIKVKAAKSKSDYDAKVLQLKREHERVQNTISRISRKEDDLEAAQIKCKKELIVLTKKQSDLEVLQEKIKVEKRETKEKTVELENMLEKVRDKERRLDLLRQALDGKRKSNDRKRNVASFVEDSRDSKKHKAQSSSSDICHSHDLFPETLRRPSSVNRPPPPRKNASRYSFSLSAFVPRRPGVNRPSTGVAKRRDNSTRLG